MRIVVCVKHVPDVQSERRIEAGRVVRGEDDVLNELDENAIEAGVELVERFGGECVALTMGPQDAEEAVMRALQMGADRGILVSDDQLAGADAIGTARVLHAAINRIASEQPVDMVITGMASLDGMTSMLPSALAAMLGMPHLGLAHSIEVDQVEGAYQVDIERSADGFEDTLRSTTPLLVSVTDQLNEPRFPTFAAMKAAHTKPLEQWELTDLDSYAQGAVLSEHIAAVSVDAAQPAPLRCAGTVITDSGDGGTRLAAYLKEVL